MKYYNKINRILHLLKSYGLKRYIKILRILFLPYHNYRFDTQYHFPIYIDFSKDVDARFYLNDFEICNLSLFEGAVTESSIVIDVGANIGIYSILAARKAQKGKVFAFEPADEAFQCLKKNIQLNNLHNVFAAKTGVSNFSGEAVLSKCADDAYNSLGTPMKEIKEEQVISVITLDEFCSKNSILNADVIKIDTEGADYLVLKGASKLLDSSPSPVIFCEYNRFTEKSFDFSLSDLIDFIHEKGFKVFEIKDNTLSVFDPETSRSDELICLKPEHYSRMSLPVSVI